MSPQILLYVLIAAFGVAVIVSRLKRLGGRSGGARHTVCAKYGHDWGTAEADTGWDQKCRRCGAWKSGYGHTWR